ncbi:hypothetical protein FF36_01908 [Frankia torreyi]|uniref:Uncharacterized protein n=1 Tax=Frankia torreyi TaxID=1856 RepID=A0A0D8BHK8_9ACTN|nr:MULTISPECIES: hypothetical protein [Frankia]KJE23723.1 hypothetical protein FF36_01908 [Frankia torreyi]KQC38991.1 hypothetical protein UK82_07270 [Frankia sp. ACN1ag]
MTAKTIPLTDLLPDDVVQGFADRTFARAMTAEQLQVQTAYGSIYAEVLVDAIDTNDVELAAAAVRWLVAHVRAGRARWHELDQRAGGAQ